jgi:F0F1-type ATP synthase membrane subunit b/b'
MDTILESLAIDGSFFSQLVICIAFFFIAHHLFFDKLKFILLSREEKTTKLEAKAEVNFQDATEKTQKYQTEIDEAYKSARTKFLEKQSQANKEAGQIISQAEGEAENFLKTKRADAEQEVGQLRTKVLEEVEQLSNNLVEKVIK